MPLDAAVVADIAYGVAPDFETPLASFVRQARKVIDPAFIAPEEAAFANAPVQ